MAKKANLMIGLGILSIVAVLMMFTACYFVDVLIPFFDLRKQVKATIKHTDNERKRRYYKKKYRYMKLEIIPLLGPIFYKMRKKYLKRDYID